MNSPYAPPQAEVGSAASDVTITAGAIDALRGTKVWVLLVGILLFVIAALSVLGGVAIMFSGGLMGTNAKSAPPAGMMAGMGVMYIFFAVIYGFLGLYLVKYSSAIGRLLGNGQAEAMEEALQQQRKFWRLAGVLALIGIVFVVLGIGAAVLIPAMMAAGK